MNTMTILPLMVIILLILTLRTNTLSSHPLTIHPLTIHELLKSRGLPGGLFPKNVKSFTLSQFDLLEVFFDEPCEAKFETLVRFDSVVRANLTFGSLIGVEGLSQEELFLWLPVKGITVKDPSSGVILFDIGVAQKQLAFSLFEDLHVCSPESSNNIQMLLGRKGNGHNHQFQR